MRRRPRCAAKLLLVLVSYRPLAFLATHVQYAPPLKASLEKTLVRKGQHRTALLPLEQHGVAEDALGLEGRRHVQQNAVVVQRLDGHAEVLGRPVRQY